jgi:hypothetical protein
MTYPSLVCLGAAYINLLLSGIVLMAYVWGTAKADQWEGTRGTFEKACTALKITLSSAAAGSMYANQSSTGTTQSLWGQACNPVNQADQLLTQLVNFDQFCTQQVRSLFDVANGSNWRSVCTSRISFLRASLASLTFSITGQISKRRRRMPIRLQPRQLPRQAQRRMQNTGKRPRQSPFLEDRQI